MSLLDPDEFFAFLDQNDETIPYSDIIDTRFPIFLYVWFAFDVKLCVIDRYTILPDSTLLFWITAVETEEHVKIYLEKSHENYQSLLHFITESSEEFLEGEFDFNI